jgi:hypothetical protein
LQGAESAQQGGSRESESWHRGRAFFAISPRSSYYNRIFYIDKILIIVCERRLVRGDAALIDTQRKQHVGHRGRLQSGSGQAAAAHPLSQGPVGQPRGRSAKNLPVVLADALPVLLADALNESVGVKTNGRRRRITKREAVIAQLVNKSAGTDLRATKMLIDMLKDIEKKAGHGAADTVRSTPVHSGGRRVVAGLVARIRRQVVSEIATTNGQDTAAS